MRNMYSKTISRRRAGLTLIETMVSLAITSSLLVAVAAAYNASASAVSANANFFKATQAARITMNQMLSEIRQAESVQVYSDHIDVIRPASNMAVDPSLGTEVFRRFQYDATNSRITLQIFFGASSTPGTLYEMATNISSVSFGPAMMGRDWNNTLVVQHVPITLNLKVGTDFVNLSGSAGPRRAQQSF